MKKWKATLDGGKSFVFASNAPYEYMAQAGIEKYALMQIIPTGTTKMIRDGKNYYTADHQYFIERCLSGWDVHELGQDGRHHYSFTVDTLKELRMLISSK